MEVEDVTWEVARRFSEFETLSIALQNLELILMITKLPKVRFALDLELPLDLSFSFHCQHASISSRPRNYCKTISPMNLWRYGPPPSSSPTPIAVLLSL